ncbi:MULTISPECIES: GGDEF domain-containing protein [Bacillaceae]|uniref:GGDEF domain-containing protein n=1 Tax=Bacillaceae TaxID=186817 RepID=UPI002FFD738D
MMLKARLYDGSLFMTALVIAFSSSHLLVNNSTYMKVLAIFLFFSCLYFHLRVFYKNGSTNIEYGISYNLAIVLFTGPLGLFIFEFIYRFLVYFYRKATKTADPSELSDTFYNIGCHVITNIFAYFLFHQFHGVVQSFPFGFWILIFLLVCFSSYLSGFFLVIVFRLAGEPHSFKEAIDFIFRGISFLDYGKVAVSNGMLLLFLQSKQWEMLISLFILNYIVSRSFYSKSQSIQDKLERDQFEQMAYTDFLTGVYNRTFMDKKMTELNESGESLAIVVADIDNFKSINDNYNHAVGDKVIQHFAATLKNYLWKDDFLFRSGGEEFTLCLRKKTFDHSTNLIKSIIKELDSTAVEAEYNGELISIKYTASFGLYYYQVNSQFPVERAYIQADELLYQSKQRGKNCLSAQNGLHNQKEVV